MKKYIIIVSALCFSYGLNAAEISISTIKGNHKNHKQSDHNVLISQFKDFINKQELASAYSLLVRCELQAVIYLIEKVPAVNTASTHKMKWNLLHIACQANDLRIAEILWMKYPDLFEQPDVLGRIPLFYALITGRVDLCNYFLRKKNLEDLISTQDYHVITQTPGNYWDK